MVQDTMRKDNELQVAGFKGNPVPCTLQPATCTLRTATCSNFPDSIFSIQDSGCTFAVKLITLTLKNLAWQKKLKWLIR